MDYLIKIKIKFHNFINHTKFLLTISLRNLLRQKRRNIMLGSAMAFGVLILIVANSFAHGISDIMFNKLIVYMTGHVGISINEGHGRRSAIFRDKERLFDIINRNVDKTELKETDEAISIFCRAIGNGKADNVVVVGIDMSKQLTPEQMKEYLESFHVVEGNYKDVTRKDIENPVILSKQKAESMNLKMNDIVRFRYRNLYGQDQAAFGTVVAFMSNDNIFMQGIIFLELGNIKRLMGYKPYECGNMQINLKHPARDSVKVADKLHEALKPGPAFIAGTAKFAALSKVTVLPFMSDEDSKKLMRESISLVSGKMDDVLAKDGVMITRKLAASIGAVTGSKITVTYKPKFEDKEHSFTCKINGIFNGDAATGADTIFMHESLFYKHFYEYLPDLVKDKDTAFAPPSDAKFGNALGKEWVLLNRTSTTDEAKIKFAQVTKRKIKAATIDIATMYETASDILKLEGALNLITLIAVLILFFIIILGVINTLRMTIRERTREIGTIRAIGMQRNDVRGIFMLETLSLTFISAIVGTLLSFAAMWLLSLLKFSVSDNPMGILLLNRHLHFMPTVFAIFAYIILILIISGIAAYIPSRRAANMSAAEALRHYE